jgi:putative membrane protein
MFDFALVICVFVGFLLGAISGLTPGLHINNFAALTLAVAPFLLDAGLGLGPFHLAAAIFAASISQTFLDSLPAIFVGAPEADTALSVLPGHSMMLEGRGFEAIRLSAIGCAGSVVVALILIWPLTYLFSHCYDQLAKYAGFILLEIAALMILTETGPKLEGQGSLVHIKYKLLAAALFIACGLLGKFALDHQNLIASPQGFEPQVLLPMLSGLFGASSLLISLTTEAEIPRQKDTQFELPVPTLARSVFLGSLGGSLVAWMPGISPAVATIATRFGAPVSGEEFLVSISGVNAANAIFSLIALYVVNKPRSGAAAAVKELVNLDMGMMMQMLMMLVAVALASYLTTIFLGMAAAEALSRLNYRKLCLGILAGLVAMNLLLTGAFGGLIFAISTILGLVAPVSGIRKTHAMGVLMLPLILMYI